MTEASAGLLRGQRALWRIEDPLPGELRQQLDGLSVMVAHLLWCRGLRTADEIAAFFSAGAVSHDPFLLPDMAAAVDRIRQAITQREKVAIYGDFDCDGLTAAAVLEETLRGCGVDPLVTIPTRADGHGLHPAALAALADAGVTLVITADTGVGAIEEVRAARGLGLDVVVTDHHEARADGSLPSCPTVAPTRHDSEYPCRFLCGVGIAYKLAQALGPLSSSRPDDALDLVALGTIADVVPLRDENRSLVVRGLQRLRRTQRPGLLALFQAAGVERSKIDPISVAYYLAPRLNAANRLASPQMAYDLITADDPTLAAELAAELSAYNQQRQLLVTEHLAALCERLGPPALVAAEVQMGLRPPLLLEIGDWPAGISGLLAAKLVDEYGLPAFVGTVAEDGSVGVSARGVPGLHLDEMLESCEAARPGGLFQGFGGHAGAGGFQIEGSRLREAQELLEQQARAQIVVDEVGSVLTVDAEVSLRQLTLHAARQVASLAPFGVGFPEPLFLARDVTLRRLTPVGDGKHARFSLERSGSRIDGVHFNADPSFAQLPPGSKLDVVFHLQIDEWNELVKPEVRLRDWRLAG